jgi:hypothetical protein
LPSEWKIEESSSRDLLTGKCEDVNEYRENSICKERRASTVFDEILLALLTYLAVAKLYGIQG